MNELDIEKYLNTVLKIETKRVSSDELLAKCPIHKDKNPSFYINRGSGLWQCKSCQAKGSIESLSRILLGKDRSEQILKKCLGIDGNEDSYLLNKIKNLTSENEIEPKESFDESSFNYYLRHFSMGPDLKFEIASKIKFYLTPPLLQKYQIKHWTKPGAYYNRLAIPIHDLSGEIVNINFRRIDEKMEPKYCCLPTNASKKRLDECVFLSKQVRDHFSNSSEGYNKKLDYILVTEGCFDAIFLGEHELYSSATFSNSVTHSQLNLYLKITKRLILFFDGDRAGIQGMNQKMKFLNDFIPTYQIKLQGCDPDEIKDIHKIENEILSIISQD